MRPLPGIAAAAALLLAPLAASGARAAEGEWRPWTQLEGSVANSLPDCLMQGRRIDCWVRSTTPLITPGGPPDGPREPSTLLWNSSPDGDTWSGWVNLGGTLRVGPKCVEHGGRFDCFGATQPGTPGNSQLARLSYDDDERGEWVILAGGPQVSQRPSCITGPGQAIDCFVTTTTGEFWRVELDMTGEWSWEEVSIAGLRTEHRPECVARAGGIDCFIIETIRDLSLPARPATARNLWARRLDKDGWGDWEPLAPDIGEPPHCLVSGVKLDCFSRTGLGAPFQLVSATYNGRDWSQWIPRGGDVQSQPYCNKLGGGFDCYWTSPAGELWRSGGDETAWSAPENLSADSTVRVQQRPVCLAKPGAPRIDCFALGSSAPTAPAAGKNVLFQKSRD